MHPFLNRLGGAWLLVTGLVAGVDTYQGLPCAPDAGVNFYTTNANGDGSRVVNALLAVPTGAINGALYNFTQAIDTGGGACGAGNYTHRIAGGLADLFHTKAVATIYDVNQAILGVGGAAIGGIVAEEVKVLGFRHAPS